MSTANNRHKAWQGNTTKEKEERCSRCDVSLIPNYSHCIHNWPVTQEISNSFKFRRVGRACWWLDAFRPLVRIASLLPTSWPEVSILLPPLVAVDVAYPHYHITPLATATFFCSQCGRCGEVRLRNNFVFVPNRLPRLFARWPEMTRPFAQKSAPWE